LLEGHIPLTYTAHPDMLRVHGNQWDEADFKPVAGFGRYDRSVMAPRADSGLLVPIWFDLRRAADFDESLDVIWRLIGKSVDRK